jgi:hypothetical protein
MRAAQAETFIAWLAERRIKGISVGSQQAKAICEAVMATGCILCSGVAGWLGVFTPYAVPGRLVLYALCQHHDPTREQLDFDVIERALRRRSAAVA